MSINYQNLYRAFVSPHDYRDAELTIYVEARDHAAALDKIVQAVATIEEYAAGDSAQCIRDRVYNLASGQELIDSHFSDDMELRLFEVGSGHPGCVYDEHPLFLVRNPAPLFAKWLQTQQPKPAAVADAEGK